VIYLVNNIDELHDLFNNRGKIIFFLIYDTEGSNVFKTYEHSSID